MMKERGLTFTQALAPKVLDGSKTVTRRLGGLKEINENPDNWTSAGMNKFNQWIFWGSESEDQVALIKCPQGIPGDTFYMKEAWGLLYPSHNPFNYNAETYGAWREVVAHTAKIGGDCEVSPLIPVYKADPPPKTEGAQEIRWRSGRYMPKWACRPQRWDIVSIRPERVQEITRDDLWAEGYTFDVHGTEAVLMHMATAEQQTNIMKACWGGEVWDPLNAKQGYPWEKNNWVWRVEWNPEPVAE